MMKYHIVKKSEQKTATWAGGTTTQLAIFPPTAEYQKFNFDFRISYATVEVEESTFTFMPGVTRHLMILKGSLKINHINRYEKELNQFDIDTFSGEWPTKAKGKVTDFNLMTKGNTTGSLEAALLQKNEIRKILVDENSNFTGFYLLKGTLLLNLNNESITLDNGDFILIENEGNLIIELFAKEYCELIISKVKSTKT